MTTESIIALKAPEKPFPVGTELGVLKWRFQTTDESFVPMTSMFPLQSLSAVIMTIIDECVFLYLFKFA